MNTADCIYIVTHVYVCTCMCMFMEMHYVTHTYNITIIIKEKEAKNLRGSKVEDHRMDWKEEMGCENDRITF